MSSTVISMQDEVWRNLDVVLDQLDPQALGVEMAARLAIEVPELAELSDPDFHTGIALSCTDNLTTIWGSIRETRESGYGAVPPPAATAWARELAHRGLPLSVLLRAYRLGHGYAEQRIAEATQDVEMPAEVRWSILAFFTQWTFEYIDAVCTQLVEAYEQERARWVRGAAAARAECVQAIIDRRPIEVAASSERLGYDVSRKHVAFIVWADVQDSARRVGWVESAASELASALGGGPSLTIPVGERVVWGWTSGDHVTDDPASIAVKVPSGLRAAVGSCGCGPDGMADSHDDALVVRRASEFLGQRPGSVLGYRSCSLAALLTADPVRAARFVETELGALAASDDAALRLRATLRTYFEEGLSPARAGRRLSIHLNTVVYRVKQAEELLGRRVDERRFELEAALRLAERLPALRAGAGPSPTHRH